MSPLEIGLLIALVGDPVAGQIGMSIAGTGVVARAW